MLTRKRFEKLMIGDNIVLTVRHLTPTRVAIGIEAPKDVKVLRGEVKKDRGAA